MSLNDTNLKKIRVLLILIISITFFVSTICLASASTTFDVQDPEGKYTFKITFPNGEGVEYESGYHVEDRGEYLKISFDEAWDHQNTIDVKIEVEGVDIKDWGLYDHGYPTKRDYETTDEFALRFSSGCTQLKYCGAFYNVHVTSRASKGSANLPFILVGPVDETDDFFITPTYQEIEYGETIDFTLKKERNGIYSEVDDSEVKWIVAQSRSLSDFRTNVIIGTIDNDGVFTTQEIGTCTVFAKMDGEIKSQAEVVVKCSCDKEGDLDEVIRLYQLRIPEGPYHRDLKAGKVWSSFIGIKPGTATNLYSNFNDEYGEFTCGAYQDKVLVFLSKMQSTPEECHLLSGYDFGPIEGSYAAHHATVVYPKGTDWKKTGMVFDPWPQQKPEVMPIGDWEKIFSPIAGDTSPGSRHKYNTTKDPNDYQYAAWTAAGDMFQDTAALVGFGQCPVNILITDSNGRQLGAVDDSNMAFDIPNAFIMKMSDEEGGYQWYFTLPITDEYDVDITAFDDGEFEFFVMNTNTGQLQHYGEHPIKNGEVAEVELSSQDPTTPMILPGSSEVIPTLEKPVIPEISDTTLIAKAKGLPGFELWIAACVIFLVMLFRRS